MIKINSTKELASYFRNQIEDMGFIPDGKDISITYFSFGGFKTFSLDRYTVDMRKVDYMENVWDIKITHYYPIFSEKDKPRKIIMNGSSILKEIAIGKITMYSTMELDILNINELLEYISNIDVVKTHLRKKKLKKINGRLGTEI